MERKSHGVSPGGLEAENPPTNAGDLGLIPGQEAKIPDAAGQIRPCDANIESLCCSEDPVQPKKEERKKKDIWNLFFRSCMGLSHGHSLLCGHL